MSLALQGTVGVWALEMAGEASSLLSLSQDFPAPGEPDLQ